MSLITPVEAMARLFEADGGSVLPNVPARYNIAPTMDALVLAEDREGVRKLGTMRWGLVPSWSKAIDDRPLLFNARSETIGTKKSFAESFERRRCLVLADSFFEWQKREDGSRQAYRILPADEKPFAMAGIWDRWVHDGQSLLSVAIVTTEANETLKPLHHRMPVVLKEDQLSDWMQPGDGVKVTSLMAPCDDQLMKAYPVGPDVGKVANDGPELWEEAEVSVGKVAKNKAQMTLF